MYPIHIYFNENKHVLKKIQIELIVFHLDSNLNKYNSDKTKTSKEVK